MTRTFRALLLLPILALAGCFEYTEELEIYPDGSARLALDFRFNEALSDSTLLERFREKTAQAVEELENDPAVAELEFKEIKDGDRPRFRLHLRVRDVRWLADGPDDNPLFFVSRSFGKRLYRFEKLDKKRFRVRRLFNGNYASVLALPARLRARNNSKSTLEGSFARFTIIAPWILGASDGAEEGLGSASWRFALDEDAVDFPDALSVDYRLDEPAWVFWAWSSLIAALALTLLWFRGYWRRGGLRKSLLRKGVLLP